MTTARNNPGRGSSASLQPAIPPSSLHLPKTGASAGKVGLLQASCSQGDWSISAKSLAHFSLHKLWRVMSPLLLLSQRKGGEWRGIGGTGPASPSTCFRQGWLQSPESSEAFFCGSTSPGPQEQLSCTGTKRSFSWVGAGLFFRLPFFGPGIKAGISVCSTAIFAVEMECVYLAYNNQRVLEVGVSFVQLTFSSPPAPTHTD